MHGFVPPADFHPFLNNVGELEAEVFGAEAVASEPYDVLALAAGADRELLLDAGVGEVFLLLSHHEKLCLAVAFFYHFEPRADFAVLHTSHTHPKTGSLIQIIHPLHSFNLDFRLHNLAIQQRRLILLYIFNPLPKTI